MNKWQNHILLERSRREKLPSPIYRWFNSHQLVKFWQRNKRDQFHDDLIRSHTAHKSKTVLPHRFIVVMGSEIFMTASKTKLGNQIVNLLLVSVIWMSAHVPLKADAALSPERWIAPAIGGQIDVGVGTANWVAYSPCDWVTISPPLGSIATITAQANTNGQSRSCTLSIAGVGFTVNQHGVGETIDPDLPFPTSNFQNIPAGSLVIPMDNTNQSLIAPFNLKAYGLVNQLLQNGIPVRWAIRAGKAKDEEDFNALVSLIAPTNSATISGISFAGGPFIVSSKYTNEALPLISSFSNNVVVYRLAANTLVDIRHELRFRPKIGINSINSTIHGDLLDFAGITNYTITADFALVDDSCYSLFLEPHTSTNSGVAAVRAFVQSGGNFLAQCKSVETYELADLGHFQSSSNVVNNLGNTLSHPNPDLPYCQFMGVVDPVPGGALQDWTLGGGIFTNNGHVCLDNVVGNGTQCFAATASKHSDGRGGMVFYLGGHNYLGADISQINAKRMILNAVLVPPNRPSCNVINFGNDLEIAPLQDVAVNIGDSTNFIVAATGTTPFSYQWRKDGTNLFSSGNVSGVTTTNLVINNVQISNVGSYSVVVTNPYGSITSSVVALRIILPPQNFVAVHTNDSQITLQLTGTPNYPYILQTATNLTLPVSWLTISTNPADGSGAWYYVVTNSVDVPARFFRAATP